MKTSFNQLHIFIFIAFIGISTPECKSQVLAYNSNGLKDLTPPNTHVDVTGFSLYQNILSPQSVISISSYDQYSGVENIFYRFNQSQYNIYRDELNLLDLEEGFHEFYYQAVDQEGNLENENLYVFYLDKTGPSLESQIDGMSSVPSDGILVVSNGAKISLTGKDDKAGMSEIYYQIDGREEVMYLHPFIVSEDLYGRSISFYGFDRVNNRSKTYQLTFSADKATDTIRLKFTTQ